MKQSRSYGPDDFAEASNVSRETLDRLGVYVSLLLRWNQEINLIGRSTEKDLWRRHILDSAQIYTLLPTIASPLVDLGSGAGFPGLILAILGVRDVHLVESDKRKAAFLRQAAQSTGLDITIHAARIEELCPFPAAVVTARALAPLSKLLHLGTRFESGETLYVFPKGQYVDDELTVVHKMWKLTVDRKPSQSDPTGTVLCLSEVCRVTSE